MLELKSRSSGFVKILGLVGRFDAVGTPTVKEWMNQANAYVVINLADVHFIDSTGLALLVQARKQRQKDKGDLVLCCLQSQVRSIFELTRLDLIFQIFDNEARAIQELQTDK